MTPLLADMDDWGGLIFLIIVILLSIVGAIRNAVKEAGEKRRRRTEPGGAPAPRSGSWQAAKSDLTDFLQSVKRAAEKAGAQGRSPAPPRPPRPAPRRPTPVQPVRRPVAAQPAPRPVPLVAAPSRMQVVQPDLRQVAARRRLTRPTALVEEPVTLRPVAAAPKTSWLDRLPTRPLKRAIVLREILGPPVARAPHRGRRPFDR